MLELSKIAEQLQAGKEGQFGKDMSEQSRRAIQEGKIPDPQEGQPDKGMSEESRRAIQEGKIPDPHEGQMPDEKHQQEISRALLPEDYQKELDAALTDKSEDWARKLLPNEGEPVQDMPQEAVKDEVSVRDASEKLEEQDRKGIGVRNKENGMRREGEVREELEAKYPNDQGYKIQSECFLCDEKGNIAKDPVSDKGRRIDFVVAKDGKAVESVEVTSLTAPKDEQMKQESRIREKGGNYIKDRETGEIVPLDDITSEIWRRT